MRKLLRAMACRLGFHEPDPEYDGLRKMLLVHPTEAYCEWVVRADNMGLRVEQQVCRHCKRPYHSVREQTAEEREQRAASKRASDELWADLVTRSLAPQHDGILKAVRVAKTMERLSKESADFEEWTDAERAEWILSRVRANSELIEMLLAGQAEDDRGSAETDSTQE